VTRSVPSGGLGPHNSLRIAEQGNMMNIIEKAVLTLASAQQLADEREAIHQVVSGYYDAFARDPTVAATFYGEPTLIVLQNEVRALATRSDVEAFLAKLLGSLKPLGYSNTKLTVARTKMVNATTALYSTVAIRMKTDGTELQKAGFTYLLQKGSAGWKIHEVIATGIDKLIVAD
jgi:hypothetical protein